MPAALSLILLGWLLAAQVNAATLTVTWAPNSEADLAGYKVYFGTAPRTYGSPISIGPTVTSYHLTGLSPSTTHYVALTAFDTSANESDFSEEAHATTLADWWPSYHKAPAVSPVRRPWWPTYKH